MEIRYGAAKRLALGREFYGATCTGVHRREIVCVSSTCLRFKLSVDDFCLQILNVSTLGALSLTGCIATIMSASCVDHGFVLQCWKISVCVYKVVCKFYPTKTCTAAKSVLYLFAARKFLIEVFGTSSAVLIRGEQSKTSDDDLMEHLLSVKSSESNDSDDEDLEFLRLALEEINKDPKEAPQVKIK